MVEHARHLPLRWLETALPGNAAGVCGGVFVTAWIALYGPVYLDFMQGPWMRDENAHGPFIIAICAGLGFARLSSGHVIPRQSKLALSVGLMILISGLIAFAWARIQEVDLVLSATQILVGAGAVIMLFGFKGIRQLWFVFVLSFYLVTWPGWAVDMFTFPLKMFVSEVVANMLFAVGLPVSHDGAIINAGVYELLVADACAGLNSFIALTSIGVVYLYIVKRASVWTNLVTLLMLAPIAIFANIIRVAMLVMITHFFGYDAGQSFLHELSGLVMFAAALLGVFATDAIAHLVFSRRATPMQRSA